MPQIKEWYKLLTSVNAKLNNDICMNRECFPSCRNFSLLSFGEEAEEEESEVVSMNKVRGM